MSEEDKKQADHDKAVCAEYRESDRKLKEEIPWLYYLGPQIWITRLVQAIECHGVDDIAAPPKTPPVSKPEQEKKPAKTSTLGK